LLFAGCGDADSKSALPASPTLTSAQVLQPGPYGVGVTTITFVDSSRPTMPNGTFAGLPSRTLATEIWYPTDSQPDTTPTSARDAPLTHSGAPFPLVLYSHGLDSHRTDGAYLAVQLTTYGYIVAAPDFPLSNDHAPGGPTFLDLANQPGDLHFLIDQLLTLAGDPHGTWAGSIDRTRIGAAGFSGGGTTTLLAAFHPTLRDPRVRAAAAMAPPACVLGPDFFGHTSVPLLIVQGDIDAFVSYQANAVFAFHEANPPKYLVTIAGGSHVGFGNGIDVLLAGVNNPDDIGCRSLGGKPLDVNSPAMLASLGGAAAGIISGVCPRSCATVQQLRSIRPARQHELVLLSIFPFLESYLRGDASARSFLNVTLAAENSDATVALQ